MLVKYLIKTLIIFLLSSISLSSLNAQDTESIEANFKKNDLDFGVGIGFGSHLASPDANATSPMITVSADYALRDDLGVGVIGLGGLIGYEQYRREYSGGLYGYDYSSILINLRGIYHYQFLKKFDTYAGLGFGFRVTGSEEFGTFPVSNYPEAEDGMKPSASIFVGGRYYFTDKLAAFGEVGTGVSYLTLGVTFKMK